MRHFPDAVCPVTPLRDSLTAGGVTECVTLTLGIHRPGKLSLGTHLPSSAVRGWP